MTLPSCWTPAEREFYRELGYSIKAAREAAGHTQSELADLVQSSRAWVTNIEGGRAAPSVYRLVQLMAVLGPHAVRIAAPGLLADPRVSAAVCCEGEALGIEGSGHSLDCAAA